MALIDPASVVKDPFLQSILESSASLRAQTSAILDLLAANASNPDVDISQQTPETARLSKAQKLLTAQLSRLRGQNRRLAHVVRQTKAGTSTSRVEIDTLHLSLQNLYYEQRHLMGEIAACESYPHPYSRLPLIDELEFMQAHPQWLEKRLQANDEQTGQQGLMRARIDHEHSQRQELDSRRQALLKRKMELQQENAKRKDQLVKLDKDLEAFVEAAKPIQKTFEKEY